MYILVLLTVLHSHGLGKCPDMTEKNADLDMTHQFQQTQTLTALLAHVWSDNIPRWSVVPEKIGL